MAQDVSTERACPGEDIISELPDMLRLHILTLLPRKAAVRTGALSTKWKDLWKERYFHPTNLSFGRATESEEEQRELAQEIQAYMKHYGNKRIVTFTLNFYPGRKHEQMAAEWIEQAAKNGAEVFRLDFSQAGMGSYPRKQVTRRAKKFELKESMFRCNNALDTLSLSYCRLQRYFKFRYFSCLETLCLSQVNVNDFMLEKLVSNCLNLESLELSQCLSLKNIRIPATLVRLKNLTIVYCCLAKEINISAPALQTFHFFGNFPHTFLMIDHMPLLSNVIVMTPTRDQWVNRIFYASVVIWLDHVQVLTLCNVGLSVMFQMKNSPTWLTLGNLRELQLLMFMLIDSDLNNIYIFFTHCQFPLLERLFIELPPLCFDYSMPSDLMKFDDSLMISFNSLKVIKMDNFKGVPKEMLLLDFLLQRATNLECLILVFPPVFYMTTNEMKKKHIFHEIMSKPKASARAQVIMCYTCHDNYGCKAAHANNILDFKHLQDEISKS